ncbi:acyltransferase family protein [Streptomyces sp. NPDC127033]|uniref:acyltransferase family protein n=1 Tax=Streptomyces sp. NPDC127033 TaxID=3347110 RepID=UPI0036580F8E
MDSTPTETATRTGRGDGAAEEQKPHRPGGPGGHTRELPRHTGHDGAPGLALGLIPVRVDGRPDRGARGFPGTLRRGGRVRGVDGLRALAVVLVMVYHLEPDLLPGGALGVDVFFTISGFVITRLLLTEFARTGDVAMRSFYWRRWLRLVPALLAVCAFCAVLVFTTRLPSFDGAWPAVVLAATFLVNIVRASQPGVYSSDTSLLSHTWSLGVEEQFYFVWPPLLLLLLRRFRARTVLICTAVVCLLPLVWRLVLWNPDAAHRIYNGMDTRADQLLAGALLAVVVARLPTDDPRLAALGRWAGRLAWPALALLALIVWQVPMTGESAWTVPWYTVGFLVTAVLSATLVAALELCPDSRLARSLSLAPLVWTGRNLSYGLYLWHYPLSRLMSDLGLDTWQGPATVAASFVAAYASYRLLERPLTRRGRK